MAFLIRGDLISEWGIIFRGGHLKMKSNSNWFFFFFFLQLLYLESGFLSVAYLTVAILVRLGRAS